jgi:hypothetical protein
LEGFWGAGVMGVVASTARMMFVTGKQQATKTMQGIYQPLFQGLWKG